MMNAKCMHTHLPMALALLSVQCICFEIPQKYIARMRPSMKRMEATSVLFLVRKAQHTAEVAKHTSRRKDCILY